MSTIEIDEVGCRRTGWFDAVRALAVAFTLLGTVTFSSSAEAGVGLPFIRGDVDENQLVELADVTSLLAALFLNPDPPVCPDALDVNDDGTLGIPDAIYLLNYLFQNGAAPPAPFPTEGVDLTADGMNCLPPCVDSMTLSTIITSQFPTTVCFPNTPFGGTGFSVDFCTQTTAMSCAGLAGCDLTIDVPMFTFDPMTLVATATVTLAIDPISLDYTILLPGSCTSSLDATIDATLTLTGTSIGPGLTQIDTVMLSGMTTFLDLDLGSCGLLALSESIVESTLTSQIDMQIATVTALIEPLLIGQVVCTP